MQHLQNAMSVGVTLPETSSKKEIYSMSLFLLGTSCSLSESEKSSPFGGRFNLPQATIVEYENTISPDDL